MLGERLGVPPISTGEMLREAVAEGSELGRRVAGIMKSGELVDDATMAEVVRERLAKPDAQAGFILDGYPRTLPQAETLAGILGESGRGLDAAVLVQVPEEALGPPRPRPRPGRRPGRGAARAASGLWGKNRAPDRLL